MLTEIVRVGALVCRGYITEVDPRSTMRPFVRTMTLVSEPVVSSSRLIHGIPLVRRILRYSYRVLRYGTVQLVPF